MNTHKRKPTEQDDANPRTALKNRFLVRHVYFLGYTEAEAHSLMEKTAPGLTFASTLSSQITHIVLNPASCSRPQPKEKFYFAALSGADIVRPQWLTDVEGKKDHLWDTCQMEVQYAAKTGGLWNLLKLWKRFKQSGLKPFCAPSFSKTLILSSEGEDDEEITDFKSCFEVGGGGLVVSEVIEEITIRPKNIPSQVSLAVFFPGYSPDSLTELLLTAGVPVVPHTTLYEMFEAEDFERSLDDVSRVYWAQRGYNVEKKVVVEAKDYAGKIVMDGGKGIAHLTSPLQSIGTVQLGRCLPDLPSPHVYEQWIDLLPHLEERLKEMQAASDTILHQTVHSHTDFMANVSEMKKNDSHKGVQNVICFAATNLIRHSEDPHFLPSYDILSFLFHKVAMTDSATDFGVPNAVFRLLTHVLRKYPPYNKESREYWLQVLVPPPSEEKPRGARSSYNFVPDAIAAFRSLMKTLLMPSSYTLNLNLLYFVVELLETDLFMLQKGDYGLVKGPKQLTKEETPRVEDISCLPFAYLLMLEPFDSRKTGIDEKALTFLNSLAQQLAVHELTGLTGRLFSRLEMVSLEGLRWTIAQRDPSLHQFEEDAKRIFRHLKAKKFSQERVNELFPLKWISEVTHSLECER